MNDLKLIELMIKPQKDVKLSGHWKYREFLCEVGDSAGMATLKHCQ